VRRRRVCAASPARRPARGPPLHRARVAARCAARLHADAPDWGLAFFGSDRFVAVRGALAADVRWDVFIPGYRADCDFYQSVRVSGWSLQHCRAGRVVAAWQARPPRAVDLRALPGLRPVPRLRRGRAPGGAPRACGAVRRPVPTLAPRSTCS